MSNIVLPNLDENIDWGKEAATLQGKGQTPVVYLKEGKTIVHLLVEPGLSARQFYSQTSKTFDGKEKKNRYLIWAYVLDAPEAEYKEKVALVEAPRQVVNAIIALLQTGEYKPSDLFGSQAFPLMIIRKGKGLDSTYQITPARKPHEVDYSSLEFPDCPGRGEKQSKLDAWAIDTAQRSRERDGKRQAAALIETSSPSNRADDDLLF